jgi:NAD+ kinase
VTASKYPFPTVCADKASTDWFSSISRTLRWNEREKQKSFVVVEEEHEPPLSSVKSRKAAGNPDVRATKELPKDHEDDYEDEDDEEFDIDE